MALLQILEPEAKQSSYQHKLAIGIDFGTTNSLAASVIDDKVQILPNNDNKNITPSVVYCDAGKFIIGAAAKKYQNKCPQNYITSIKRLIGLNTSDIDVTNYPYKFADDNNIILETSMGNLTPVELVGVILSQIKMYAEIKLNGGVMGAVITVPAYFDDAKRNAIKQAAALAKIKVLRLINEPTAAALAYGLDAKKNESIFAVYDLGGGTFDISILNFTQGIFEVLATGGDNALGGDDFDNLIYNDYISTFAVKLDNKNKQQLKILSKNAKETLSDQDKASFKFLGNTYSIDDKKFKNLTKHLIQKTISIVKRVLRDAKLTTNDIQEIVMVGGSTRMPIVKSSVSTFFAKKINDRINPDEVVAIGAATLANTLIGNKKIDDALLLDVIPLSLGIETMGGLNEKIIYRNTTIPVTKSQEFTTYKDGQNAMTIHVTQGERELVANCRSLAKFSIKNIPAMVAGVARVRITFNVDSSGLLTVSAKELTTNNSITVEVKPSFGLDDNSVQKILKESVIFAKKDLTERQLNEIIIKANRTVDALNSAIDNDKNLLNNEELNKLNNAKTDLLNAVTTKNKQLINDKMEELEKVSEFFVARRMNTTINKAMKNRNISDFS